MWSPASGRWKRNPPKVVVNPKLCQAGAARELHAEGQSALVLAAGAIPNTLWPQAAFETRDTALEELGSSREKSHRSKLSVVYNRVSVEELPHSHLMLLDRPSASTHNRGARGPFPAFPDCHPSMPMSLVEEELAPPPFPTESAFLPAFSCSFPGAAKH